MAAVSSLDPNPKNQLGKGVFPPDVEAELIASGYVFACILPKSTGLPFSVWVRCKRPIADAVTDMEMDNPCLPKTRIPVSSHKV